MQNVDSDAAVLVAREGDTLSLTLNQPQNANALSPQMVEQLITLFTDVAGVRVCILRGAGRNFCAGFNLSDIESISDGDLLLRFVRIEQLLQLIHHAPFPVIALAQGNVIGAGADIFAACWQRIAAPDARFRMPGWQFGLALGTRRLSRLIGSYQAREMLIDSKTVSCEDASRWGLVSCIESEDTWDSVVMELVHRCQSLSDQSLVEMLDLTICDTRDLDLAALVRTASKPGLRQRILEYTAGVRAEKQKRNAVNH